MGAIKTNTMRLQEGSKSPTGAIVESFRRLRKANPNRRQAAQFGEAMLESLQRGFDEGTIDFRQINFRDLLEQVITPDMRRAWDRPGAENNVKLVEHTMDVMVSSQFDAIMKMCVRLSLFQQCGMAPYVLAPLVDNSPRIDCNMGKMIGYPRLGAEVIDTNEEELEETQFYGLKQPYFVGMPTAKKKKFAVGYTRELLCVNSNSNDIVTRQIAALGEVFDEHKEWLLTDLIFGLQSANSDPYRYDFNDSKFNGYQEVGGGAPWGNLITGDPATVVDGTSFAPFRAVEAIFNDMRDPIDNKPIQCPGGLDILVTTRTKIEQYQDLLGVVQVTRDLAGGFGANERMEIQRSPREGWNGDIRYSRHSWDRIVDYYMSAEGKNQADAESAATDTWVAGRFDEAFGWATEWERENITRAGRDTWGYFNQEVIFATKWLEKSTPMWKAPWQVVRMRPA